MTELWVTVVTLDCPPELTCKNLLLKTPQTAGQQDRETKLEMSWQHLPCGSLAVLEGAVYATVR